MKTLHRAMLGVAMLVGSALSGCAEHRPLAMTPVNLYDAKAFGAGNLLSFDVYADGQSLHAAFVAASARGKPPYIGYLHSEDGGLHWSAPLALNEAGRIVEAKAGNDIQIAAFGERLMVMWQARGELPGMGPLFMLYSEDAGNTWQSGANPAGIDGDQSHHDLAADAEGRFHAVWLDDRDENGYQGVRYARSDDLGRHWALAQTIDDSSCSCCWNRLLVGKDASIDVLYRDMAPRDMALAQSVDAGASWRRLSTVGAFGWLFDGCPHNGGGLTQAGDGSLHSVVWTGAENRVGLYHMQSADGGKTWMPPQSVDGNGFHADIAAFGDRVAMVWDRRGPEGSQVFISESSDNGASWSPPRLLSQPGAIAEFPRIVATPAGLLAMWSEQTGAGKQWSAAVFQ